MPREKRKVIRRDVTARRRKLRGPHGHAWGRMGKYLRKKGPSPKKSRKEKVRSHQGRGGRRKARPGPSFFLRGEGGRRTSHGPV